MCGAHQLQLFLLGQLHVPERLREVRPCQRPGQRGLDGDHALRDGDKLGRDALAQLPVKLQLARLQQPLEPPETERGRAGGTTQGEGKARNKGKASETIFRTV